MNTEAIAGCMKLSFANTPFPVVMRELAAAGVHAYTADLIALRKTYYDAGSESVDESLPLTASPAIAENFDRDAVPATVQAIQRREIGYADFLRQIMAAGCASYRVFFRGRKTIYFGRNGDFHVENFPSQP